MVGFGHFSPYVPKTKMDNTHNIEVVQLTEFLTYFYWGRHPEDQMMDMRLGGGSFAIHRDQQAVVIDTMARTGQGQWVRNYLESRLGIRHFTLISSHWHVDHVIDNQVYADDPIIGHRATRDEMLARKAVFEAGQYGDYDPFPVVPPNVLFEDTLDLWVKDLRLELQPYLIHEKGHLGIWMPDQKIFIANDLLEDPIWFFDFEIAAPEIQIAEFERLLALDVETIFPCHGSIETMRQGGYGQQLIHDNLAYLKEMLADRDNLAFKNKPATAYIGDALKRGSLTWWEAYTEVHQMNQQAISKLPS